MTAPSEWSRQFAVRGVFWRRYLDWAVLNLPFYLYPILQFFCTLFFYFFANEARRAIVQHLPIILPGSSRLMNCVRAFRTLHNFAWVITESAIYRILKPTFRYSFEGEEYLQQLSEGPGAIVLTAHMGSYDLGAGVFAEKFNRSIRMVRAPEPDAESARHLDASLERAGAGSVKINYNSGENLLALDLLAAVRRGEIVSIQGDRVIGPVSKARAKLFRRDVWLPSGPFMLALISGVPIYPLFVVRTGYRSYKIVAQSPISCSKQSDSRESDIAPAVQRWAEALESMIARYRNQWFAFAPIFE